MIIDLDSHLREGYFMDEVYNLPEPYARFTPQRMGDGRNHNTKWVHSLDPGDPRGARRIAILISTIPRSTGVTARLPSGKLPATTWSDG